MAVWKTECVSSPDTACLIQKPKLINKRLGERNKQPWVCLTKPTRPSQTCAPRRRRNAIHLDWRHILYCFRSLGFWILQVTKTMPTFEKGIDSKRSILQFSLMRKRTLLLMGKQQVSAAMTNVHARPTAHCICGQLPMSLCFPQSVNLLHCWTCTISNPPTPHTHKPAPTCGVHRHTGPGSNSFVYYQCFAIMVESEVRSAPSARNDVHIRPNELMPGTRTMQHLHNMIQETKKKHTQTCIWRCDKLHNANAQPV